ncbi:murein biosynthesis integral membrane protein MurJ [Candidatus Poribacteria bacterium]|mgnify:CR=1 FL=1|nr:murein biosynthesis integral membrane protein MurJ [Candidatus Poribacteria bacterium]
MSRPLARHAGVVSALTAASRVLGLVRETVFFALFGASGSIVSDAFYAANRIPNLFRDLFAEGALTAAFVPTFAQVAEKHGEERAWRLGRSVATALVLAVAALSVLGIVFAPGVVSIVAPGFGDIDGKAELTVHLTRILWPFLLFASLAAVWAGMLNSRGRFTAPAAAPMMLSVATLGVGVPLAYVLDPTFGARAIVGLAIGVLCGGLLQWGVQLRPLRREGFRYRPALDLCDPDLRRVLALMALAVVGVSATLINVVVNTRFATGMGDGPLTWLVGAFRLVQLPIGVFGVAVATVAIPSLSRDTAREDIVAFRALLGRSIRLVLVLCIPSACGLMVLARPLVSLIYGHGRFDATDVEQAAAAVRFYALGLAGYAAIKVLAPALYALGDTRRPALVSLFSIGVNVCLSWTLAIKVGLGHRGLALSVSVVAVTNVTLLAWVMRRHVGPYLRAEVLAPGARIALASAGMTAVCLGARHAVEALLGVSFLADAVALATAVGASLVAFALLTRALRIAEADELLAAIASRLPRRR